MMPKICRQKFDIWQNMLYCNKNPPKNKQEIFMKTECSYCRQHYTLDDRYEGQLLDCPQCGHKFIAAVLEEGSQFIAPEEFGKRSSKKSVSFSDVMLYLPRGIDRLICALKNPSIADFLNKASRITSKLSIAVTILYALLFAVYSLKNAMVCMTFKNSYAGMYLGITLLALVAIAVNSYLIYKTEGIFEKIINGSPSRISSLNIFAVMTFIYILLAIISFGGGIFFAVTMKNFLLFICGTAALVLFAIFALYNAVPENFAISEDEEASAGEDLIAVVTFSCKIFLRMLPIVLFLIPVAGIIFCVPEIFTTYVETFGNSASLDSFGMLTKTGILSLFLLTGFIPLISYFSYLINYLFLDIIRAVLSLPGAVENIKK
jgi:DNA-directed RNA polymerase subunit RPC12/RpoP